MGRLRRRGLILTGLQPGVRVCLLWEAVSTVYLRRKTQADLPKTVETVRVQVALLYTGLKPR
jgi:hypothetical protein